MTKQSNKRTLLDKEKAKNPMATLSDSLNQAQTGDLRNQSPLVTLILIGLLLGFLFFLWLGN